MFLKRICKKLSKGLESLEKVDYEGSTTPKNKFTDEDSMKTCMMNAMKCIHYIHPYELCLDIK